MDKLDKLYTSIFIIILIGAIFVFLHYYNREENAIQDLNGDGSISISEIEYHVKKELDKRANRPPRFKGIVKSAVTGFLRGTLMGFILNGLEGALTSGIVLAVVNPIMTGIEPLI